MDDLKATPELPLGVPRHQRQFIRLATTLELALVPVLAMVLALVVYDGIAPLVTLPPPLTVWGAGIVVGALSYRRSGDWLATGLFAFAAFMYAWVLTVGVAVILGIGKVFECASPESGCLPW